MTEPVPYDGPIPVKVMNHPPRREIQTSNYQTFIVDPASTTDHKSIQICGPEPNRHSVLVIAIDAPVVIREDVPSGPDVSTSAIAPSGAHVPTGQPGVCFYGKGPMFLNSISGAATTRVTVVKTYWGDAK